MKEIIKVGKIDLRNFAVELEELKNKHQIEGGIDTYREIQFKSMLLEAFSSKIDELERECTLYQEQIQAYNLQQGTDIITITSQDSYIKAMAPTLIAQGSISIFNRVQTGRLQQIKGLNELTNDIIINNAVVLHENAKKGADLYVNRGISTETLEQLHKSLEEGFKIYSQAREEKNKKIINDRIVLGKIQASLQQFQNSISKFIGDTSVFEELKKDSNEGNTLVRRRKL